MQAAWSGCRTACWTCTMLHLSTMRLPTAVVRSTRTLTAACLARPAHLSTIPPAARAAPATTTASSQHCRVGIHFDLPLRRTAASIDLQAMDAWCRSMFAARCMIPPYNRQSAGSANFSQPGPDVRAFSAAKVAFTNVSFVRNTAVTGGAMLQVHPLFLWTFLFSVHSEPYC